MFTFSYYFITFDQTGLENYVNMSEEPEKEIREEYAYLDRGGFSSEKFKIELRGLPKYYGIAVK